jgi:hypothetical protein
VKGISSTPVNIKASTSELKPIAHMLESAKIFVEWDFCANLND